MSGVAQTLRCLALSGQPAHYFVRKGKAFRRAGVRCVTSLRAELRKSIQFEWDDSQFADHVRKPPQGGMATHVTTGANPSPPEIPIHRRRIELVFRG